MDQGEDLLAYEVIEPSHPDFPAQMKTLADAKTLLAIKVVRNAALKDGNVVLIDTSEDLLGVRVSVFDLDNHLLLAQNERGMLHFEQTGLSGQVPARRAESQPTTPRDEDRHGGKVVVDYGEDGKSFHL